MHILKNDDKIVGIVCVPPKALKVFRKELETKLHIKYSEISAQNTINNKSRILLISHTKLDACMTLINNLYKQGYKLVFILDEAHVISAENNQLTKVITTLRPLFTYCWFLTATPCGNDIWGLYTLVNLVDSSILGSKEDFKNNYLITQLQKVKKFNPWKKRYEFKMEEVIVAYKNIDILSNRLNDIIIVKQKQYNIEFVYHKTTLDEEEKEAYFDASKGLARDTAKHNFAVRLNDLQRVVDNSSPAYSDSTKLSSKEKLLIKTVDELIDEHILIIYTELNDNVERLTTLFNKLKMMTNRINNIYVINGATSFKERGEIENKISEHDIIIITQAGTTSINLQKADSILLYDIPFSMIQIIQCIGRITRTDTKFAKQYIHFIECNGTIDTYRRLNVVMHTDLITKLFGPLATLPLELTLIDTKIQKQLRNKLLWSFTTRRLPTDLEIEKILNRE